MERLLITGSEGLLGSKIVEKTRPFFDVIPTHYTPPLFPNSVRLDITNENEVSQIFRQYQPKAVIHAAAETNVDKCETDRRWAKKVNVFGTKNLATVCGKTNTNMIYISTDYVFDGKRGLYRETDGPDPINYYGLTKLKGEWFVKSLCRKFMIARTSVLYGKHPTKLNFSTWVIKKLKQGERIAVVDDHYNSPTLADNLAEALLEAVRKHFNGLFHVAGSERISRYDFAIKTANIFDLDANLIKPIKTIKSTFWVAKRPKDSSLCIDKAKKRFNTVFFGIQKGLSSLINL
jgi:dTDP-4-dehydrorhamnose reductase